MSFATDNLLDEAFRIAQFFANHFDNLDIPHFIVASDIIDFADTTLMEKYLSYLSTPKNFNFNNPHQIYRTLSH
mgnify:CR=1 FL=1